jgi:hypothetical protein
MVFADVLSEPCIHLLEGHLTMPWDERFGFEKLCGSSDVEKSGLPRVPKSSESSAYTDNEALNLKTPKP